MARVAVMGLFRPVLRLAQVGAIRGNGRIIISFDVIIVTAQMLGKIRDGRRSLMSKALYFGYGSNLNADNWSRWCSDKKYPETSFDASFKKVANAWLADYRPGFTVWSSSRNGGVLDVVEAKGCVTPGVLFEVSEATVAKLDRKEGAPGFYNRIEITVQTADGFKEAFTYQVRSRQGDFIQPSEEYTRIVSEGLKANGLDDEHIRYAAAWKEITANTNVFIYGTLRTGERLAGNLGDCPRKPACVRGRLYNLGWYPGLYLCPNGEPVVGEVVTVTPDVLARLDQIEGFQGCNQRSLYHRVWLPKEIWGDDGNCWTYVYAKPESELNEEKRIVSGDWCNQ